MGFREFANENAQYIVLAMNEQLDRKISFAISIIQSAAEQAGKSGQPLERCYSGGKDSDVILELAKMALRGGNTAQFIKTRQLTRREQLSIARKKALKFSNQK